MGYILRYKVLFRLREECHHVCLLESRVRPDEGPFLHQVKNIQNKEKRMEGGLTWGDKHNIQMMYYRNCISEIYVILTNVTSIN